MVSWAEVGSENLDCRCAYAQDMPNRPPDAARRPRGAAVPHNSDHNHGDHPPPVARSQSLFWFLGPPPRASGVFKYWTLIARA